VPVVEVNLRIAAPVEDAWRAVTRIEDYPEYMDNVQWVRVGGRDGDARISEWSVLLKGSVLEWVEKDVVDEAARTMTFHQVNGDLDHFSGYWRVTPDESDGSLVSLFVEFEIGIPLLAEMLDPVAAKALRENSEQMLRAIEQRVAAS
jgi:ribosome-associated toxin RatA of RatAB toxin-antitoxin module